MTFLRFNLGGALLTIEGRRRWRRTKYNRRTRARRSAARHERAKARHRELVKLLGGRCAECKSTHRLEIDHVDGREWRSKSLAFRDRVARYWREYKSGVYLRVLCRKCNGSLGARMRRKYPRPAH